MLNQLRELLLNYCGVPDWDSLCIGLPRVPGFCLDSEVRRAIRNQEGVITKLLLKFMKYKSRNDPSFEKFLDTTWEEALYFTFDQWIQSRNFDQTVTERRKQKDSLNRRFVQLPCTKETLESRVSYFKKNFSKQSPILILGDDDKLSISLVKEGFEDVTAVDIDVELCKELEKDALSLGKKLKVLSHDLNLPIPKVFRRPYTAVFMDPIYNIEGIRFFLKAAKSATDSSQTKFLVCVHLISLFKKGNTQLDSLLKELDMEVQDVRRGV